MLDHPDFDAHEAVHQFHDLTTGLRLIIAVHSTHRGAAAGGTRLWAYDNGHRALSDVLRLSRGMSYKNAMAGLNWGGGKAVIWGPIEPSRRQAAFEAMGRYVNSLDGAYITAEDVGVSVEDMKCVARHTPYVSGLPAADGAIGGDPSPWTARGVRIGMESAVRARLDRDLKGVHVAVQGLGHVGSYLCRELKALGAQLTVADINPDCVAAMVAETGAKAVSVEDILTVEADVLAPCALGGVMTEALAAKTPVKVLAGGANNQLATAEAGAILAARNILYAPDYVINAGGIIAVSAEYHHDNDLAALNARIAAIGTRLESLFSETASARPGTLGQRPEILADDMARQLIGRGGTDMLRAAG